MRRHGTPPLATLLAAARPRPVPVLLLAVFLAGPTSPPAAAQEGELEPGTLLRVTRDSTRVQGHLWFIDDASLVLQTLRRDSLRIPLETIRRIERATYEGAPSYSRSIGLGVAAGAGAFFLLAQGFEHSDGFAAMTGGGLVGGTIGALVALAGTRPTGWEEIPVPPPPYSRPPF